MRKIWGSFVVSVVAAATLTTSALAAPAPVPVDANAAAAAATASDPTTDVMKAYLLKHELKFKLDGSSSTLDGKKVQVEKSIEKDGRVYVPLRTLQLSGAATSVTWDASKRQVAVVMNPKINPGFDKVLFKIGSDRLYGGDGTLLSDYFTLPKPFISNGITYVPIRALAWLGVSVSTVKDAVTWNWSDKVIEVKQANWTTDQATTTFTLLYENGMYVPSLMHSLGSGAWAGGSDSSKVVAKGIELDGRVYNRIQITSALQPGINPMQVHVVAAGAADLTVKRTVADPSTVPVNLSEEGQLYLTMTAPTQGYLKVKAGEAFTVAGKVANPHNLDFDKVTLIVQKYMPSGTGFAHQVYQQVSSKVLAITKDQFSGALTLSEPGSYWIAVNSPSYLPWPEIGSVSTKWADIVVEVE